MFAKRNNELIREILFKLETGNFGNVYNLWRNLKIKDDEEFNKKYNEYIENDELEKAEAYKDLYALHQIDLMKDAGFFFDEFVTYILSSKGMPCIQNVKWGGLSNKGHDFIDSIREEEVWNTLKKQAMNLDLSANAEIGKKLAIGFAKKKLEKETDIKL